MIQEKVTNFINSRFSTADFITKKRATYLFYLNALVITFMPLFSVFAYFYFTGQFLTWLIATQLCLVGSSISLIVLHKKRYMAAGNTITAAGFIGSLVLFFSYANSSAYQSGVIYTSILVLLLSFLFLNRVIATLYWIAYIAASIVFAFVLHGTGVAWDPIINILGVYYIVFIFVYFISMLIYSTFYNTNQYNQELLGKSEADNETLKTLMNKIREHVFDLSTTAEQMSQITTALSDGTQQQAANAEQISAGLEEISAVATQNMENSLETRKVAGESSSLAEEGSVAVKETVEAMREIIDKIDIIDDIVVQTNLLSINAAIEASKAGTFGKGFSVVAREVKLLAEKSKESLKEMGKLSTGNIAVGERAVGLFERILPCAKNTAVRIEDIAAASEQQDMSVRQITAGIQQLNEIIQQNATAAEQLASTAERLSSSATNLQEMVNVAKIQ